MCIPPIFLNVLIPLLCVHLLRPTIPYFYVALGLLKLCFVGKTAATRKEKKKANHVEEHVIEALNETTAAIVGNIPIYLN